MSYVIIFFIFLQTGEASKGRVCYQRGLPRLVSISLHTTPPVKNPVQLCVVPEDFTWDINIGFPTTATD